MSANGHSGDTGWIAKGFPPEKLDDHFKRHGKQMGFKSRAEYNNAAVNFMNKEETSNTESFIASNGSVYKYDYETNEFGIAKSDGTMITYYKPTDKVKYWEDQKEKYDNEF